MQVAEALARALWAAGHDAVDEQARALAANAVPPLATLMLLRELCLAAPDNAGTSEAEAKLLPQLLAQGLSVAAQGMRHFEAQATFAPPGAGAGGEAEVAAAMAMAAGTAGIRAALRCAAPFLARGSLADADVHGLPAMVVELAAGPPTVVDEVRAEAAAALHALQTAVQSGEEQRLVLARVLPGVAGLRAAYAAMSAEDCADAMSASPRRALVELVQAASETFASTVDAALAMLGGGACPGDLGALLDFLGEIVQSPAVTLAETALEALGALPLCDRKAWDPAAAERILPWLVRLVCQRYAVVNCVFLIFVMLSMPFLAFCLALWLSSTAVLPLLLSLALLPFLHPLFTMRRCTYPVNFTTWDDSALDEDEMNRFRRTARCVVLGHPVL
jgi:hypothetical protein